MRNENITSRQVINYLDSLYKPLTPSSESSEKQAEADFVPIILKDTERFLDVMLRIIKPKRITCVRHGDRILINVFRRDMRP